MARPWAIGALQSAFLLGLYGLFWLFRRSGRSRRGEFLRVLADESSCAYVFSDPAVTGLRRPSRAAPGEFAGEPS